MSNESSNNKSASVFRIDKFAVPADALPEFIERLHVIQRTLGAIPGCQQNLVLTQTGGPGEFNVVTIVEWANKDAVLSAIAVVEKKYAEEGFNPAEFVQKLRVRPDLGLYTSA
jgi:hypothetical protein